jgi:FkbM family methyltransferase
MVKRVVGPLLDEDRYSYIQCAAKAWDIWRGTWSEPELDVARAAVRTGDVVLDVGANFGLYSYHLSRAVGPAGRVYAFEPVPFTNKTLRRVARVLSLDNVEVVAKGCSDTNERITFSVPLAPMGTLSAGMAFIGTRSHEHDGKETQVRWHATREFVGEVVRLDDFLPEQHDVSFFKIDIEGAEPMAFAGAMRLLERHRPTLVVEINPFYLRGFGKTLPDLIDPLFALDYRMYRYDDTRRGLVDVSRPDVVEDNYVFVHPRRRDRLVGILPS